MASNYEWGINPFRDFLMSSLEYDVDISDKEIETDVYIGFTTILKYFNYDEKYEKFLDYEIRKDDICFRLVPQNALTALWVSGIMPKNPDDILNNNKFEIGNREYKFNRKTKRLTFKELK